MGKPFTFYQKILHKKFVKTSLHKRGNKSAKTVKLQNYIWRETAAKHEAFILCEQ